MTTKQKAKAYDEAWHKAKRIINVCVDDNTECRSMIACIQQIFPELAESEDEKIRKWLIGYFQRNKVAEVIKTHDILAWLEKQGEQKPVFEMKTAEESLGIDSATYNKIVDECIYGEQNPADKLEPKFHKGEWIISKYMHLVMQILNNDNGSYKTLETDGTERNDSYDFIERNFKLWTIKDAKDGDVLSDGTTIFIFKDLLSDGSVMSYCDYDTDSGESDAFCPLSVNLMCSKITPTTKEQRDILFQKMREASYEWDAEKKELKKINSYCQENCKGFQEIGKCFTDGECKAKREAEQKPTNEEMKTLLRTEYEKGRADAIVEMQNPSWSEEDECYMSECIGAIATKDGWSFEEKRKTKHWLKSLKERIGG